MHLKLAAAFALLTSASVGAQSITDLGTATPVDGTWTYAATSDGSEASFTDAAAAVQLAVHCTRATRHVSISKAAGAAAPALNVWTSSLTRSVPSAFNPTTGRLTIDLANYDPLLDALATSRGRIGFSVGTDPALVVPAWAEIARVVEDCRA